MTGEDLRDARATLGALWGLGRPLGASELGRLLRLSGKPGHTVLQYESGRRAISGPVSVCIEMWLAGYKPPNYNSEFFEEGQPDG